MHLLYKLDDYLARSVRSKLDRFWRGGGLNNSRPRTTLVSKCVFWVFKDMTHYKSIYKAN